MGNPSFDQGEAASVRVGQDSGEGPDVFEEGHLFEGPQGDLAEIHQDREGDPLVQMVGLPNLLEEAGNNRDMAARVRVACC